MNDEKNESVDEQLLEQPESEQEIPVEEERQQVENKQSRNPALAESTKIIKTKVKKRIAIWLATSGCACCLPIIIFIATIGIVTIVVFYIQGFFDSSGDTTQNSAVTTTVNNGSR